MPDQSSTFGERFYGPQTPDGEDAISGWNTVRTNDLLSIVVSGDHGERSPGNVLALIGVTWL